MNTLNNSEVQLDIWKYAECISNVIFKLFYNWRSIINEDNISKADAIAQCILQMMHCKMKSFLKLSEGTAITPHNDSCIILDIPSLATIVRSMYELTFIFHNIYAEQKSEAEKDIIIYLWVIRGLNNRQGLSNIPYKYKEKEEKEKAQIKELRDKIKNIIKDWNISNEIKRQIEGAAQNNSTKIKGYRFIKDSNNRIISFKDIRMEDYASKLLCSDENLDVYRLCSIHTHPSFLGILQFGQMYKSNADKQFLKTLTMTACKLSCTIIKDFTENIKDAHKIYQKFSETEKDMLNLFYNKNEETII